MSGHDLPLVVLAAGAASRFGSDKLLAPVEGRPLLATTLARAARVVDPELITVAVGADHRRREVVAKLARAQVVVVPDAARGMRWTLQAALASLPLEAVGALVALADDPLALDALATVRHTATAAPRTVVAVRRSPFLPHPVYLPRSVWPPAPTDDDDTGLRALLDPDSTTWIDDDGARPIDVDEPADLVRLRAATRQRTVDLRADEHDQR